MRDWNVVVSVRGTGRARRVKELLAGLGRVALTNFYNVLLLRAREPDVLLDRLGAMEAAEPRALDSVARVTPVARTFTFQSRDDFHARARDALAPFVPRLAGKSFHVRVHRRGFKGRISSLDEEQALDGELLDALDRGGTPGRISFEEPDAVLDIEMIGTEAGVALLTREEIEAHPILDPD